MNSIDVISMGLRNMWRRKTRTILTVLGVIIGTSSIVIMLSLGIAMNENFKKEVESMGSLNIIEVSRNYGMREGGSTKEVKLDDKAIAKIGAIEGVEAVTPLEFTYWKFGAGKYVGHVSVIGIDTKVMDKFNFEIEEGRLLDESDTNAVVFGSYIPEMFYNPKSSYYYDSSSSVKLISDKLIMTMNMDYGERRSRQSSSNTEKLPEYKVKGVGILKQSAGETDYNAYMNIKYLKKIQEESNRARSRNSRGWDYGESSSDSYNNAMVKVKDINNVKEVQEKIKDMGFNAFSLTDILESMQKTSASIQAILGGIGAVSLLVAALGITNTMIMSIYERTREIGVMKVLGAELGSIRRLFLFEAGLIGFMGGILGIGFSLAVSLILNKAGLSLGNFFGYMGEGSKVSVIPLWLMLASVAFATLIGLVSGYYPARRAMKLSALEAIKTE
ncbi:ABC transporter permease [Lutispora thermophila]|uniref:ABC-type transport system, involved in lipoprotein release, permease component n=1 Tax=Lutispora thermophila DSM 19022 TaxID=1122184 RepID=A0A1M6CED0_9FIRM|nr:FtsX-like permease family protein [Lutispora thermophila]SHI59201.1 ABC-type transport system, involved in lipoprotein release, permease component [Lutispora thermophila DSM 19022]